ncbi:hypothetical protein DFH27DRAFT_570437 [Peziza echinospora]|nr:hypothetical protein DFH27DRAFT_570437 [Peziza echinospora]
MVFFFWEGGVVGSLVIVLNWKKLTGLLLNVWFWFWGVLFLFFRFLSWASDRTSERAITYMTKYYKAFSVFRFGGRQYQYAWHYF